MSNAQDIWNALIAAGASSVQAAGIMGNMFYESSLNPEAAGPDSNGFNSYGLVQWNTGTYKNAATLVTGNTQQDIKAQVNYLAQTGGFKAASGATAAEAGSNFAANYERCQGCQSGGGQNESRSGKASQYFAMAQSGNWSQSSTGTGGGASSTSTQTANNYDPATCLVGFNLNLGGALSLLPGSPNSVGTCYVSKTEARALIAGLILGISAGIFLVGTVILVAYGFKKTGAANAVGNSLTSVAGPTRVLGKVAKKSTTRKK